jgi:hypothetical protein
MSAIDPRTTTLNPAAVVTGLAATDVASPSSSDWQDPFSARAGADVSYRNLSTYAVFRYNAEKHTTQVAVYSEEGRLVRLIPPGSVAEMVSAMSSYRPRR